MINIYGGAVRAPVYQFKVYHEQTLETGKIDSNYYQSGEYNFTRPVLPLRFNFWLYCNREIESLKRWKVTILAIQNSN